MNRNRRVLPLSVLAITLSPIIFGSPAVQSTALQISPGECRVTTSGKERPDRLPAQAVWESTFKRISADRSSAVLAGIDGPRALRLATSGARRLRERTRYASPSLLHRRPDCLGKRRKIENWSSPTPFLTRVTESFATCPPTSSCS